jgi:biotin-dependent carboxylase-like uncharacterized protein
MALRITAVGPGATIQDGGRTGFLRFGVTPSGPMDWTALWSANLVLGNAADAAAVELAAGGLTLVAETPLTVAFAGGGFAWTLDGRSLPPAARVALDAGAVLRARAGAWGTFAYLAVPGGLDTEPVMGSRSTHLRSHLGGLDGRMLAVGDHLAPLEPQRAPQEAVAIAAPWLSRTESPIRVVLGPQDDYFTPEALALFCAETFVLTPAADRMAYTFAGPRIAHKGDFNIVSDGVALGAIQVAGNGHPLVLMADRQPTGGYPKIAHVCRADIGRLAQLRPGDRCRFEAVDTEAARRALLDLEDQVATVTGFCQPLRNAITAEALLAANLIGGVVDALD